jgi:hypothetical protein
MLSLLAGVVMGLQGQGPVEDAPALPARSIIQYGVYAKGVKVGVTATLTEASDWQDRPGRWTSSVSFGRGQVVRFEAFHTDDGLPIHMHYRQTQGRQVIDHVATFHHDRVDILRRSTREGWARRQVPIPNMKELVGDASTLIYSPDPETLTKKEKEFVTLCLVTARIVKGRAAYGGTTELQVGRDARIKAVRIDVETAGVPSTIFLKEDGTVLYVETGGGQRLVPEPVDKRSEEILHQRLS